MALRFKEWLGHDNLGRVTPERVQAWGDERNAQGIAAKTINDTDFAALRAVFKRGQQRGWLASRGVPNLSPRERHLSLEKSPRFQPEGVLPPGLTNGPCMSYC